MSLRAWLHAVFVRFRPEERDTGREGERHAAEWLQREKRFHIIARNWRAGSDARLEIDIVARDREALVFVEVKSRPATALVPGYFAAVNPRKKKALRRAARAYVRAMHAKPLTVRFDIVEVIHEAGKTGRQVLHFENVPLFGKEYRRGY